MCKRLLAVILWICVILLASGAYADITDEPKEELSHQQITWKLIPIEIALPVGKERMITFPAPIELGYDKLVLPEDTIRVQNNNGALYLLAKKIFPTQRVAIRMAESGKIILLDLTPKEGSDVTPIDIVAEGASIHPQQSTAKTDDAALDGTINYMTLTRFAVQQLYASKRLLTSPGYIYRTPMHTKKTVLLLRDGSAIAMPLASWRSENTTVTAILLRNVLKQALTLDPRSLCGKWQAATFYPRDVISPAGTPTDSSTVFLITQQPFSHALLECK